MEKEGSKEKEPSFVKAASGSVFLGRLLWEQGSCIQGITPRFSQSHWVWVWGHFSPQEMESQIEKPASLVAAWGTGSSKTSLEIFGNTVTMNTRRHIGLLNLANDIQISWHFSEESLGRTQQKTRSN